MLTQYKNIDEILTAAGSTVASRYTPEKHVLLNPSYVRVESNVTSSITTELHVYVDDSWITGNHNILETYKTSYVNPTIKGTLAQQTTNFQYRVYELDIYKELTDLNLTTGKFRVVANFFNNLIGNYDKQYLTVDEISPDRTEIKLRAIYPDDPAYLTSLTKFINDYRQTDAPRETGNRILEGSKYYFPSLLLNFSRNKTIQFVNNVVVGEFVYVKLQDPISADFTVDMKCWISQEMRLPYIDQILLSPQFLESTFNVLAGPNWLSSQTQDSSADTKFKTWNDLLGSTVQTSQQIVDAYFSGSLAGMKLNIDYSDFNNFVFYSSATERLENFRYKLELIEYYASQSLSLLSLSGSAATSQSIDVNNKKTSIISGFDTFEQFLYYESSSKLTTYTSPHESPNVASITGSYITPAPKINSTKPYTLYATTSSVFDTWYNNLYVTASLYDTENINALIYSIPEYIKYDELNVGLSTFVNMLGHHYDILYTYINHITKINKREENPKLGMPGELLHSVAKQFGWNLTNGNQYQDLWQYVLGTDSAGIPLTGSNTVGDPSVSGQQMTYAVWRRIVNNLPLLLKSKGTKRSVQALLSCYGIPQSLISINEYGGPRINRTPIYQKLNFDYALDTLQNPSGSVTINYTKPIRSVELRFRLDDVLTNPTMSSKMNLYTIGSNTVDIDFTSGTLGKLRINGTASANIELFDGGWLSTLLRTTGSKLELVTKRSKYGKIVAAVSASATASFASTGTVTLASSSVGYSRIQGQLQELRLWTSSLQDAPFNNHVKAPSAYDGNVDAYDELVFRLPLTQKINHNTTSSLTGVQPITSTISASFTGWTTATPYDSIEEMYYYDSISAGAGVLDDNKIRLEDNTLIAALDVRQRSTRGQFDTAPIDSKKLGVYFSPQTMINEDIIAHLGAVTLDEYIGDPNDGRTPIFDNNPLGQPAYNVTDQYPADDIATNALVSGSAIVTNPNERSYPDLIQYSKRYWKKYLERNDMNAYINMFTLYDLSFFKQLEQLLPARANKLTGILIQPNILERSKDTVLPAISRQVRHWNMATTVIDMTPPALTGDVFDTTWTGEISQPTNISGSNLDIDAAAYLTGSETSPWRYTGFEYSRTYVFRSGSTWITGSTPYWISEALMPCITGSTPNPYLLKTVTINGVKSYVPSEVSSFMPIAKERQSYLGTRMTSPEFNVASPDTIDRGPVVEISTVDGNQLYYQSNSGQGNLTVK
jgi:hypothetical protein